TLEFLNLQNQPGVSADKGFARLKVTMDGGGGSATSLPLGWLAEEFGTGTRTLGVPFRTVVFSSKVTAASAGKITVVGNPPPTTGYVEVTSGIAEGTRFNIIAVSENEITLVST